MGTHICGRCSPTLHRATLRRFSSSRRSRMFVTLSPRTTKKGGLERDLTAWRTPLQDAAARQNPIKYHDRTDDAARPLHIICSSRASYPTLRWLHTARRVRVEYQPSASSSPTTTRGKPRKASGFMSINGLPPDGWDTVDVDERASPRTRRSHPRWHAPPPRARGRGN